MASAPRRLDAAGHGLRAIRWRGVWLAIVATCAAVTLARAGGTSVLVVKSGELASFDAAIRGFRERWRGEVDVRVMPDTLPASRTFLRELSVTRPNVFFALGARAATHLSHELPGTPVVFAMVLDPERLELAGRNVAGVEQVVRPGLQLAVLRRLAPRIRTIGIPFDPAHVSRLVEDAAVEARRLGFEPVPAPVVTKGDAARVLPGLTDSVEALWLPPDSTLVNPETLALTFQLARERRIPVIGHSERVVEAGALAALAVDELETGRRAAEIAERIATSTSASRIGIVASPVRLVINAKVAATLGIEVSESIRREAARIVE